MLRSRPSLVSNGSGYGLAWSGNDATVYFVRLDAMGNMQMPQPTLVASETRLRLTTDRSLVFTGTGYAIAYLSSETQELLRLARLDATGTVVSHGNTVLASGLRWTRDRFVAIVFTGTHYYVSYDDVHGISSANLTIAQADEQGQLVATVVANRSWAIAAPYPRRPELVWDGEQVHIVTVEGHRTPIRGTVKDAAVTLRRRDFPVIPWNHARSPLRGGRAGELATAALTGTVSQNHWAFLSLIDDDNAWSRYAVFGGEATPHDPPALAWTGDRHILLYADDRHGDNPEIYVASAGPLLFDTEEQRLTHSPGASFAPAAVWTGQALGVVWTDQRETNREIYFALLDAGGNRVSPDIRITQTPGHSDRPAIAYNDLAQEFGITWTDSSNGHVEVYFQRVGAAGDLRGGAVRITHSASVSIDPDLAWADDEWVLVWADDREGQDDIYLQRLSAAGVRLGEAIRVTQGISSQTHPAIIVDGQELNVLWLEASVPVDDNRGVNLARVLRNGTVVHTRNISWLPGELNHRDAPDLVRMGPKDLRAFHLDRVYRIGPPDCR